MALANTIDVEAATGALTAWLTQRLPEAGALTVTDVTIPSASGLSAQTVLFRAGWTHAGQPREQRLVARVQPDGPGMFRHYDLAKEAAVMRALAGHTAVPAPRVLFHEADPAVLGAPFLVMEYVAGRIPGDDPPFTAAGWVHELTSAQRTRMWDHALRVLADIHGADWRGLDLGLLAGAGGPGDWLDTQLTSWEETFAWANEGRPHPTIEPALGWLRAHRPAARSDAVLSWGDARIGNLIFADDLTVGAVLDWEMVTVGGRELDLGWWLFLMRHHTEGIGIPLPEGIPTREQTIARYEELTGHSVRDIDYYEALAATRLAIIMVRAAHLMVGAGLLPPDTTMATSNPANRLLAGLLELPVDDGESVTFIGNR